MATYSDEEFMWDVLSTPDNISHKEYRRTHGKTWLTKDRKILRISSMETSHIINSIDMLKRAGQQDTKAYQGLTTELNRRNQQEKLLAKKKNR